VTDRHCLPKNAGIFARLKKYDVQTQRIVLTPETRPNYQPTIVQTAAQIPWGIGVVSALMTAAAVQRRIGATTTENESFWETCHGSAAANGDRTSPSSLRPQQVMTEYCWPGNQPDFETSSHQRRETIASKILSVIGPARRIAAALQFLISGPANDSRSAEHS
jgi:hypothetical protein